MPMLGPFIHLLARSFDCAARYLFRLADLCHGLLPALFPRQRLSVLLQDSYIESYAMPVELDDVLPEHLALFEWERDVMDRYGIKTGRMLVLGAGTGREAIGLARRGLQVVGIDTNRDALRTAHQLATRDNVPARFLRADFLALPFFGCGFRWAILSSLMYSAIPGKAGRQRWLRALFDILEPDGLLILNFSTQRFPLSRVQRICRALNRILIRLSAANPEYQEGDECLQGHFLHVFQHEEEIRRELTEAGATVRELDWRRGVAVVAARPPAGDKNS